LWREIEQKTGVGETEIGIERPTFRPVCALQAKFDADLRLTDPAFTVVTAMILVMRSRRRV